jgi:tRNA threonylcarbamoyl adenosine modification protein YjeE
MATLNCELPSLQETEHLGQRIAACLRGGDVLALRGELGAGKTSLINAIGESLGVADIASPSFSLAHEHVTNSGLRLVHIDAWRITSVDELAELGWDDWIIDANTIICLEWADRIEAALADLRVLEIQMAHTQEGRHAILQWADQSRLSSLAAPGDTP